MKTVIVYELPGSPRGRMIAKAMMEGIRSAGDNPVHRKALSHSGVEGDAAVFYGFMPPLGRLMQEYNRQGKPAVHVDLGYWGRTQGGHMRGYHKVAVNSRHPTDYFQNRRHDGSRVAQFGVRLSKWGKGKHILVAGMSAKNAMVENIPAQSWERDVIARLQKITDRPIWYRPKPSDGKATPIQGVKYAKQESLEQCLKNCHAVVTHHSNVGIDGIVAGVPCFSELGVATAMGKRDIGEIESPLYPDERQQWLNDIAYCQWNIAEMTNGDCWRHLKNEGLV